MLPTEDDPDTFVRKHGAEGFRQRLELAHNGFDFIIGKAMDGRDIRSPYGQSAAIAYLVPLAESITDRIVQAAFVKTIAERLGVSERLIYAQVHPSAKSETMAPEAEFAGDRYLATYEGNFIRLVISYPELLDEAQKSISPQTFTDQFSSYLYSIILECFRRDRSLSGILSRLSNPEAAQVVSMVMAQAAPSGNTAQELSHTIKMLHRKSLKNRLRDIRKEMKATPSKSQSLLQEYARLSSRLQEISARP
jgi:DNA primase